ncbi:hypothetical protein ACPCKU_30185, partial [Streptomyces pseudogriseolus]
PSGGEPRLKCSPSSYDRSHQPALRRPIESVQYTSFAFTAHLIEADIDASIGTVGDALDNALMESRRS